MAAQVLGRIGFGAMNTPGGNFGSTILAPEAVARILGQQELKLLQKRS
ncbi:MAG: hypothetical protein CM15mV20_2820 [uncultured marine virus]|nr:MAG: hypothetical protein CM15mV20_2820 [uncultured marine virus]